MCFFFLLAPLFFDTESSPLSSSSSAYPLYSSSSSSPSYFITVFPPDLGFPLNLCLLLSRLRSALEMGSAMRLSSSALLVLLVMELKEKSLS